LNFLAHQYLSFGDEAIMVGNFIADTVKGRQIEEYPADIQKGIRLHRLIDDFTDTHRLVLETRKHLYPYFSKYAAVVQDVYYDHFLAIDWQHYHPKSLPDFAQSVYRTLNGSKIHMNERAARTLHYMELQNWLANYASTDGIDRTLKGMASRARFASNMQNGIAPLKAHFHEMKSEFDAFFPELELAVRQAT
jgi:acyl carrier protein phosphodiesterase